MEMKYTNYTNPKSREEIASKVANIINVMLSILNEFSDEIDSFEDDGYAVSTLRVSLEEFNLSIMALQELSKTMSSTK